jgi:hypothetical protein
MASYILDEHYSPSIALELRALGHDVVAVKERPDLIGMSDADLLDAATRERRCLVTQNVGDLRRLHRTWTEEGRAHAGLAFVRAADLPGHKGPLVVGALDVFMRRHTAADHTGNVVWVER